MYVLSDKEKQQLKEEATIKVDDPDMEKFIDIEEPVDEPEEEVSPEEQFSKGLEDQNLDTTGRNMAMDTFNKIEKGILSAYELLDDAQDR
jgi:hypothetical protein